MLLIGLKNVSSQEVLTDGLINLGNVYRRYCKRATNGLPTFAASSNGVTLNGQGMYHITAVFVVAGSEAGDVTVQLLENGEVVTNVISTETITTADTEFRTLVIDYYTMVDSACVLGCNSTVAKTISFQNAGVGATYDNVIVNVEKVV